MTEERKKEIEGKLVVIAAAYSAGQIKIYKVAKYQDKPAPLNANIYRIKYIAQNKIVYDGAYMLKKEAEKQIGKNVAKFLLIQLATQL